MAAAGLGAVAGDLLESAGEPGHLEFAGIELDLGGEHVAVHEAHTASSS
jgi:hypothetical protein